MASDERRSAVDRKVSTHSDGCDFDIGCVCSCDSEAAQEQLAALRAENAAMREALEKIASETAATWVCDTARAALGGRDE